LCKIIVALLLYFKLNYCWGFCRSRCFVSKNLCDRKPRTFQKEVGSWATFKF